MGGQLYYVTYALPLCVPQQAATHFILHLCHSTGTWATRIFVLMNLVTWTTLLYNFKKRLNSSQTGKYVMYPTKKEKLYPICIWFWVTGSPLISDQAEEQRSMKDLNTSQRSDVWFKHIKQRHQNHQTEEYLLFYPSALQVRCHQVDQANPALWISVLHSGLYSSRVGLWNQNERHNWLFAKPFNRVSDNSVFKDFILTQTKNHLTKVITNNWLNDTTEVSGTLKVITAIIYKLMVVEK